MELNELEDRESDDTFSDVAPESTVGEHLEMLIDKGVQLMKKLLAPEDTDEREMLHIELLSAMDEVAALMNTSDPQILPKYIILSQPKLTLEVIYSFLSKCFSAIGTSSEGESTYAGGHLSWLLNCIVGWTSVSKEIRQKVVHDGHLLTHIEQLAQLSSDEKSEISRYISGNTIGIIWNCVHESIRPYHYSVLWVELLEPWIRSPYPEIRLQCKFILGRLCSIIPDNNSCLDLNEEDMAILFSLLKSAIRSPELMVQEFDWEFSALELVIGYQCISMNPKNVALVSSELVILLFELLQKADTTGRIEVCKLLWTLLESPESCFVENSSALDFVKTLENDEDSNLNVLSSSLGIVSALKSKSPFNIEIDSIKCSTYMEGCLLTNRYRDCIKMFDKFVDKFRGTNDLTKANILKAKALYNVYIDDQMRLHENADIMSPKDLTETLKQCYGKVKKLIIMLGDFIDDPTNQVDDEIRTMLDSAMMDYIHETNKLHELQRCYLCNKKVVRKASLEDPSSQCPDDVTRMYEDLTIANEQGKASLLQEGDSHHLPDVEMDTEGEYQLVSLSAGDEHSRKRRSHTSAREAEGVPSDKKVKHSADTVVKKQKVPRLIKSHLFPRAIIERFAHAVPHPKDAKVITSHMPGLAMKRMYRQRLISPGASIYMLCHTCENTLSAHGESQFMTQFFDKLYDTKDPSKSTSEQVIKYSVELYNFCIGLIFRTLYWSKGKYTNENELYLLLRQCRQVLLSVQMSLPKPEDLPDVYILISPLFAEESELAHGFMNTVLSSSCLAIAANSPKNFIQSQYFLIHIGAINILVKLAPLKDVELPTKFRIDPIGGNYYIAPESARKAYIPQEMWSLFQLLAQMKERRYLESGNQSLEGKVVNQPSASTALAYGITSGRDTELQKIATIGLQPSPDPNIPKVINFLPNQCYVRPYQQETLKLPPGHRLLLHETAGDRLSGNTIFVAVKINGTSEDIDKPYVIWHYYNQGIQINFGFFIAMSDGGIKAGDFLVNTQEKFRVSEFPEVIKNRNNASNVLPGVLQAKGFYSIQSLMNKVVVLRQNLSVVDLQCSVVNDSQCWYCEDLCSSCLNRVSHTVKEVTTINEKSIELKLCAENCAKMYKALGANDEDLSPRVHVLTPGGNVSERSLSQQEIVDYRGVQCCPILSTHEELLHLYSTTCTSNQWFASSIEELSLCRDSNAGQDCLYATYCKRGLLEQPLSLEFFVSETFEPGQLFPYYDRSDEATSEMFDALKTSITVQKMLAIAKSNISSKN